MSRPQLKDSRFSVSQVKARMSELLRHVKGGQSVIVTDHGRDIARIERIAQSERLVVISPRCSFSDVRNIRAPEPETALKQSAFELLREDRVRR